MDTGYSGYWIRRIIRKGHKLDIVDTVDTGYNGYGGLSVLEIW